MIFCSSVYERATALCLVLASPEESEKEPQFHSLRELLRIWSWSLFLCCDPPTLEEAAHFYSRINFMCWNCSRGWHSFKGFRFGCSTHMLLQKFLGKRVGNRQKNNNTMQRSPGGCIPKASHRGRSLSSFPNSCWSPEFFLVLGFSLQEPWFFTAWCSLSFPGKSFPCGCWVRAPVAFPHWCFLVYSRSQ